MHDPRVKRVTVTRAEVSGDLQHAKVYVSIMGTEKEQTRRSAACGTRPDSSRPSSPGAFKRGSRPS